MTYIKAAIITMFLLICALIASKFLAFDTDNELNLVQEEFLKGKTLEAKSHLHKLKKSLPPSQYQLYLAYVLREENQLSESTEALQQAAELSADRGSSPFLLEIYLNQALNAYLSNQPEEMDAPLAQASAIAGNDQEYILLLKGVQENARGNYAKALQYWENIRTKTPLSPWMKKAFDQAFPPLWFATNMARDAIEDGKYLQARQSLEIQNQPLSPDEQNEINFLFGLSYVKEAQDKPLNARTPYYKLAYTYFQQVPMMSKLYTPERLKIKEEIQKNVLALIDEKSFQDVPFYMDVLANWQEEMDVKQITDRLIALLNQNLSENNWKSVLELSQILHQLLQPGPMRQSLENKFVQYIEQALHQGKFAHLDTAWDIAELFSEKPEKLTETFSTILRAKILELLLDDDLEFNLTAPYLTFWQHIQTDPKARFALATKIVTMAENVWQENIDPQKAIDLMKMALVIVPQDQRPPLESMIEKKMRNFYLGAIQDRDFDELAAIYKAVNELKLTGIDFNDKSQLQMIYEDARKDFADGNDRQAKTKIEWILKVNPGNIDAQRLAGLVNYSMENYAEALSFLKQIPHPDAATEEALAVSAYLIGNSLQGSHALDKVIKDSKDKSSLYHKLAFGSLAVHKPEEGLEWFKKIEPKTPQALAGTGYAYFLMKNWNSALRTFQQLPAPYNQLWGIQAAEIMSLVSLGNLSEAESLLQKVEREHQQPPDSDFPPVFASFKKQNLDGFSPDFIAGWFYKEVKKDYAKAISYFSKISNPPPIVWMEIGEAYFALNEQWKALAPFEKAIQEASNDLVGIAIKKRILPRIAAIYAEHSWYYEASQFYSEYLALVPKDRQNRSAYANVLKGMHRYDLALQQYEILAQEGSLSTSEIISVVDALVHLAKFELADDKAKKLLENPEISFLDTVRLARLMYLRNNQILYREALKQLQEEKVASESATALKPATVPQLKPEHVNPTRGRANESRKNKVPSVLTEEEAKEYILLKMIQGKYDEAQKLADLYKSKLESNASGLMLLAKLALKQSQNTKALEFAKTAQEKAPQNLASLAFLSQNSGQLNLLDSFTDLLLKEMQQHPGSISLSLALAQNYLSLTKFYDSEIFEKNKSLQKVLGYLKKTGDPKVPLAYFLKGKALFQLEQYDAALEALNQALELNPSSSESYGLLSQIYMNNDETEKTSEAIENAVKFAPDNAENWMLLAEFDEKNDDDFNAISALQSAIKYEPNNAAHHFEIAKEYLKINNPEKALEAIDKAMALEPKNVTFMTLFLQALKDPNFEANAEQQSNLEKKRQEIQDFLDKIHSQSK